MPLTRLGREKQMTQTLIDVHSVWGWLAIVLNGIAGVSALVAWKKPELRGRWVWVLVIIAQVALLIQVVLGVAAVSDDGVTVPRFHMFYGFVAFITVGLAYGYRSLMSERDQLELFYGVLCLFLMGVGIRAWLQVAA
ncbi:MAG: hypothetical protein KDB86_12900 [Actinobacteria bacterium]|nr:hypothetical protein [Actinomycetota bacterium]